ncbi:desmoplakin-like isoform X1 [Pristis pectinata]|uniref:desmoplakin-like isoform X1 n=1 Tax=Pristis pectinata TaxID=685728 RepID=UPI00223D76E4|nr:desmoplakin-like isoform X1 [Pristis pectinata]
MSFHGSQTGLNRRLSDRRFPPGDFTARSDGQVEGFPPLHQQYAGVGGSHLAGTQMYGTVGGRSETQHTITKQRSLYSPRNSRTYDLIEQSQNVSVMDLLKTRHNISLELTENCALKLSEAEKMLQQDLNAFDRGHLGRYRHQIDALLRGAGDDLANIEDNIVDLHRNRYPTEALQTSVFRLRSQMRIIAKTISDRWTERSKSMYNINQRYTDSWDEELSRSTSELFSWLKQQKLLLDSQEWGVDATSVEQHMNNHKRYHKSLEEARRKIDKIKAEQYDNHSSNYRDAIEAIESEYESMLKASEDRFDQLRKFQDIIQATSNEIMWINDREEEELVYDWSDKNTNMAQKQEMFSILMSQLEEKEKRLNRLKQEGDQLVANNHPASDKIEAYIDTLQTQWSWILQLTKCIEVHLKENSNYFQFFEDAQVTENSLKKMQDSLRKKYVCDRSTSLQQLEKMITESEKDKEKIHEYKRQVSNLVNKSKKIVQLKPRNPSTAIDQRGPNQIILKALCDYKQDQRVVHRGNECILLDNSQRSKWRVIGPGGMEMEVPSICLLIPPPNPGAIDLANKIDQYYEAILSLWNQLYINMKSLISWQYCMIDIEKIQSWTISVLRTMSREDYELVLKNLEKNFKAFQAYSKDSQYFSDADKHKLENEFGSSKKRYVNMVTTLEEERTSVQGPTQVVIPPQVLPRVDMNFQQELQKIRHRLEVNENKMMEKIHLLIDSNAQEEFAQRTSELESLQDQLNTIDDDFISLQSRWYQSPNASCNQKTYFETEFSRISQRLKNSSDFSSAYLERMKALRLLFQNILEVEDLIKVYEARLTEEETVPMSLEKIESYRDNLQKMKMELDQKKNLLTSMQQSMQESLRINDDIMPSFYKCDIDLAKYNEKVTQLTDRWQRIYKEIDSRYYDLDKERKQLRDYGDLFQKLSKWIDVTKRKQDGLQINRYEDTNVLVQQLSEQKNLYSEIKNKRGDVEEYQKHADRCATSVKDYELQLASYSAGLETLLSIPVKRQVAQSISTTILHESADLQSRYIELLTRSGDYYKYLSEMLKSMEEAKIKNTKIELLEEALKNAQDENADSIQQKKYLDQHLSQVQTEYTDFRKKIVFLEEQKRNAEIDRDATKHSLDAQLIQIKEINEKITRLTFEIEEEKRKRKLAENQCDQQKDEHDSAFRMKQKELDEARWLKLELEKSIKDKEKEIERLRSVLQDESLKRQQLESELVRLRDNFERENRMLKSQIEKEVHIRETTVEKLTIKKEDDVAALNIQLEKALKEKKNLLDEINRLRSSAKEIELSRKRAEKDILQQKSASAEESRKRRELELQIETLTKFKTEETMRFKSFQEDTSKAIQDKTKEIERLKILLEEEINKRKHLENENDKLKQMQTDFQKKDAEKLTKIKTTEQEYTFIKIEHERISREKAGLEKEIARLQNSIREANNTKYKIDEELIQLRRNIIEETAKRKSAEEEVKRFEQKCREHTSSITQLTHQIEEISILKKAAENELSEQRNALDQQRKEKAISTEELNRLYTDVETLRRQLSHEQENVRQAHQKNEYLQKTIEEKSKALNESISEIERLRSIVENLTKERLKLEEELRNLKTEFDDFRRYQNEAEGDKSQTISGLRLQLELTNKRTTDLQGLTNELRNEREKLKLEVESFQKQALEATDMIKQTQSAHKDIIQEKESLLLKIKLLEQDKARLQRYEDELSRVKALLEAESRMKQRLQDEIDIVRTDVSYWKSQAEVQQLEKGKSSSEFERLKAELDRLQTELRMTEERYRRKLEESERAKRMELEALQAKTKLEIEKLSQTPPTFNKQTQTGDMVLVESAKLLFDGIRKKVTANQLYDCQLIDKSTLDKLLRGEKTVMDVSNDINLNLCGLENIAGVYSQSNGEKLSMSEATKKNILTPDVALSLLEAQAATGFIIDPHTNKRMTVDEAVATGLVDHKDRDKLLVAEKAATGFKDPFTGKVISLYEAIRKNIVDKETGLRLLGAQIAASGIIDPINSVYLPKELAYKRGLIDAEMYQKLTSPFNESKIFVDPNTNSKVSYQQLKLNCRTDPGTDLLLLPVQKSEITLPGIRTPVPIHNLVDAEIIDQTTIDGLNCGLLTIDDVAARCKGYLQGDSSIAGVFVEATREKLPIYQAMKKGLIRQGTAFELLEAQAATGHIIDPINNQRLTVEEAAARKLIGVEFKTKLLSAEKAVTGYKDPETEKTISLFQAMKKGLIEHNHGIRLLEAQIATGGIIDPMNSHRLPVDIAYKRNYFDEELNEILVDPSDDTKGFFDPNTEENLTYLQLKDRCITDKVTGLCLLPLREKKKEPTTSRSSAVRKRRVVIVDPETEREMTVREAYHKDLIDYETFLELSEQEAEWEEITIKGSDGSTKTVVVDRKTGNQYDIEESLQKGIIDKKSFEDYRAGTLTLSQFVDLFADKVNLSVSRVSTVMNSSPVPSPSLKNTFDSLEEPTPIAAIFDVETLEKITISEAMRRNIVDTITGQRLLEAQACTGGIINPGTGQKLSIQDAIYQCIIDEEMGKRLKPAQKAYVGFDDVKNKKRLSAAEAMQESWLPYEAGQRFLEYQSATGGLVVPNITGRITIDEAVRRGLINAKTAQKLQDSSSYSKCITCPKTKLKISYKEAVDRSMVEDKTGLRMLEATSFSTKGINSPYNAGGFSGPNSRPGSRSGSRPGSRPSSRSGSRRGSFDAGSSTLTSSTQITIKSSSITR